MAVILPPTIIMCITLTLEMILKIGAFIVSAGLFIKGIIEYIKAQNWKKAEFVSKEIKEFLNDFEIRRALILLDWNSNVLNLADNEIDNKKSFYFTDDLILTSLKTHREISGFTDEEVIIKKAFDYFFDRLAMFDKYIQTGLIESKDIKPYLIYWIKILADKSNDRKPDEVRDQIWKYIHEYDYIEVTSICQKFGYTY